eukprot:TRINITY_DN42886_c0_g1_i1.p1 TRINITY_DN42886_c0_g1~~TRINITY_DN42886_c0_g1_i1.p1  ORF type:complete len:531 (+),score=158.47 TRINITY_DN42886_c0_g1_i1:48-1595(+)
MAVPLTLLAAAAAPGKRFPADYLLKGFSPAPWDYDPSPTELKVQGTLPDWLKGTLMRTGPGQWNPKVPLGSANWFEGVAMWHGFKFSAAGVTYMSHFPHTSVYKSDKAYAAGVAAEESIPDPWTFSPNTAVMFAKVDGEIIATTASDRYNSVNVSSMTLLEGPMRLDESAMPWGIFGKASDQMAPSHVHNLPDGTTVGYADRFLPPRYEVWQIPAGSRKRLPVASLKPKTALPFFNHMMAASQNYVVLVEQPCAYPMKMAGAGNMFRNFRWLSEKGTQVRAVDRRTGEELVYPVSKNTLMMHTVNAFETDDGKLVVDISNHQTPDGKAVPCDVYFRAEYLETIINGTLQKEGDMTFAETVAGQVVRLELPLSSPGAVVTPQAVAPPECMIEVPTIYYEKHNGQPYRYAYGAGIWDVNQSTMFDVLIKVDTHTGSCKRVHTDMHFPGEATFVPRPGATGEDDGVVMSVVIDATSPAALNYLLVLDAKTMSEVARVFLPSDSHYMFQYHGLFIPEQN